MSFRQPPVAGLPDLGDAIVLGRGDAATEGEHVTGAEAGYGRIPAGRGHPAVRGPGPSSVVFRENGRVRDAIVVGVVVAANYE